MAENMVLELWFSRGEPDNYRVALMVSMPDGSETRQRASLILDLEELNAASHDIKNYSQILSRALFAGPDLMVGFERARAVAESANLPLRLHLTIDESAAELHGLRWERLLDPRTGEFFAASERVWLSRYVPASARRPTAPQRESLRALVAIANPRNLQEYKLSPLDINGELERARSAMHAVEVTTLVEGVTLNRLIERISDESPDILYLLAHSHVRGNDTYLFLEGEQGEAKPVSGSELVRRIQDLRIPPRLVVLPGCETAGAEGGDSNVAVAHRLVQTGVPAVIAMQGMVTMKTVEQFMPVFFRELFKDSQVDRAISFARMTVRDRPDWWSPVLFTSLQDGLLWAPAAKKSRARRQKAKPAAQAPTSEAAIPPAVSQVAPQTAAQTPPPDPLPPDADSEPEPEGVPVERLDAFTYSPSVETVIEHAKELASIGVKRKRPVTSSMLLYALLDFGQETTGSQASFLWNIINQNPESNYEALRKRYFRGTYLISEPAEKVEGQTNIPPDEISLNVLRILTSAEQLSRSLDEREIHLRHLLAALIAPGPADHPGGVFTRLQEMKVDLPGLRRAFLNAIRPYSGERQPVWQAFLLPPPDTRPRLFGYNTDDTTRRIDLIGIGDYVNAFAALIAARSVTPPLSIGLFGEWGSGKTFFMRQLRDAVDALSQQMRALNEMQSALPFYKHIVQIEFNAWHYMEGNIWASLAEHIIKSLAFRGQNTAASAMMLETLQANLKITETARQVAEQAVVAARQNVRRAENGVKAARDELEEKTRRLEVMTSAQVSRDLFLEQMRPDFERLKKNLRLDRPIRAGSDMREAIDEAQAVVGQSKSVITPLLHAPDRARRVAWMIAVVVIAAALIYGLGYLLAHPALQAWIKTVLSAPALIGLYGALRSGAAWLRSQSDWLKQTTAEVQALSASYEQRVTQALAQDRQKISELEKEKEDLETRLEAAQGLLDQTIKDEQAARERVVQATPENLLAGFLRDRADSADYRKHLGLLAVVRRDFDTLSSLMEEMNWRMSPPTSDDAAARWKTVKYKDLAEEIKEEGKQVNRIVLYIDDLDRCPPDKVVEVLQAVHLLLAFPLFVVVVGVDARWIKDALKARYRQMLHLEGLTAARDPGDNIFGMATPDDYLEKIFQIPFWLKPMDKNASWKMLQGLLARPPQAPKTDGNAAGDSKSGQGVVSAPAITGQAAPLTPPAETAAPPQGLPPTTPAGPQAAPPAPRAQAITRARAWITERWRALRHGKNGAPESGGDAEIPQAAPPQPAPAAASADTGQPDAEKPPVPDLDPAEQAAQKQRAEQAARSLEVYSAELEFMRCLAPLLGRSPRALKRFVNVYRLIKAGLTAAMLDDFAPVDEAPSAPGPSGAPAPGIAPYQAVLFLLAVDTGLPKLSRELFNALDDSTWPREAGLSSQLSWLKSELKLSPTPEEAQPTGDPQSESEDLEDQRSLLRGWWEENNPTQPGTVWSGAPNLDPLQKWAGCVTRYSFQVYGQANAPESAPPPAKTEVL